MTVERGTIYGLLGPSGAGKTSLLSCIVGRRKLNSGEVWVLGGRPGKQGSGIPGKRVGYMPQELALYGEFNTNDMMRYFGWIYGMNSKEISTRQDFLMDLLDLKSKTRKIKNLSGGQQRRVSLAIALMHNPELLILDEPTVGVDPILRRTIWKHLVDLVNQQNTTVIITTHYIEEAREAHRIGLMRSGKMLAEDSPGNLLKTFKAESLEGVFLKLAEHDTIGTMTETVQPVVFSKSSTFVPQMQKSKARHKMSKTFVKLKASQVHAQVYKNFLTMWRNPGLILFFILLPIVQVILFCIAIGGEPSSLKLAIVNEETPGVLNTANCLFPEGCQFVNLSCRFLHHVDETMIDAVYFQSRQEARDSVTGSETWGMVHFGPDFSTAMLKRQLTPDEDNLKQSQITVNLDMSDQQISYMLQRDLMISYTKFGKKLLKDCGKNEGSMDLPITIKDPIYGSEKPSFKDFAAPGIILTIIFFLAVGQTALSLINEKLEGMIDRTSVAGVTPTQMLFSHILCQFMIMCMQTFLVLFFTLVVFKVENNGSILWIVVLTILVGGCGMCYGYCISAACDTERTAIQIALGCFYPCILLSGVIWPVEGMHYVMQYVAYATPLTFPIRAIRSMMARGWDIDKGDVYYGFLAVGIWMLFFLILVILILKFKSG